MDVQLSSPSRAYHGPTTDHDTMWCDNTLHDHNTTWHNGRDCNTTRGATMATTTLRSTTTVIVTPHGATTPTMTMQQPQLQHNAARQHLPQPQHTAQRP